MKSCKRDLTERAFNKGYHSGHSGKTKETCPHSHSVLERRQAWLNGWRAGWSDRQEGVISR